MNAPDSEIQLGALMAVVWVIVWLIVFLAVGMNHIISRQPDGLRLFLVAGVLAAFLVSLWLVSSTPRSTAALACNLIAVGAVLLTAVVMSRFPALLAVRWSASAQHDSMLVVSSVWVVLVWLSIIAAGAVAEVHHVFHSRAR